MKKILVLLATTSSLTLCSQVIYSEDFESVVIPITTTAVALPGGFTEYTDSNVSGFSLPISDPWMVQKLYPEQAAVCPTYFTPAGQADRWMITPAITLTNANQLIWRSRIYWNLMPESYEVRLSTTGVLQSDFTTLLATINNDSDIYRYHNLSLSAWNGQTVYIAFRMRSYGGWYFFMDEIRVEDATANDAAVIGSSFHSYEPAGNIPVNFRVFNNSANQITSINLNYDVDGGTVQTQALSSISLPGFDTVNYIHSIPWAAATTGFHTLRLWTSNVNSGTDLRSNNDTLTLQVGIVSQMPVKNVMVEEHTGAWCGFCVDGAYHLELLSTAYPWVIPYAIHSSDGMSFPNGDSININVPAYPSAFFDRYNFIEDDGFWGTSDRTVWDADANFRNNDGAPCAVAIQYTYNSTTRALTATVNSTFYGNFNDNFRLNLFLVEDSVSEGTGSNWDQHNYYSSQSSGYGGPSHPFYNLPDPIIGYRHRHVCRAMLGGPWGLSNSIPASVTDGTTYSTTFNYTLPPNFVDAKVTLVGLVQHYEADYQHRYIYNATSTPLLPPNGVNEEEYSNMIRVYPNPSDDGIFTLALTLETESNVTYRIYDLTGKLILAKEAGQMNAGEYRLPISIAELPAGTYFLSVDNGEQRTNIRLISTH